MNVYVCARVCVYIYMIISDQILKIFKKIEKFSYFLIKIHFV